MTHTDAPADAHPTGKGRGRETRRSRKRPLEAQLRPPQRRPQPPQDELPPHNSSAEGDHAGREASEHDHSACEDAYEDDDDKDDDNKDDNGGARPRRDGEGRRGPALRSRGAGKQPAEAQ